MTVLGLNLTLSRLRRIASSITDSISLGLVDVDLMIVVPPIFFIIGVKITK